MLVWFLWRLLLALSCSVLIPSFPSSRVYRAVIWQRKQLFNRSRPLNVVLVAPREIVLLANWGEALDDGSVTISGDRRHLLIFSFQRTPCAAGTVPHLTSHHMQSTFHSVSNTRTIFQSW